MKSLKLLKPNDRLLVKTARTVTNDEFDCNELKELVAHMRGMCLGKINRKDKRRMVGLAAPQIGDMVRVIVVNIAKRPRFEKPVLRNFINPVVEKQSKSMRDSGEGCFSTGDICGRVKRSIWVDLRWQDTKGKSHKKRFHNITARIIQHEVDHLDGIRFPQRVNEQGGELHRVKLSEFKNYRKNWRHWPKIIDYETWLGSIK